ncbi:MAG: potassium channel family protein [Bacteroidetes bacterium]|nr:potassium channel family protein [Bacteroidota bacterium]
MISVSNIVIMLLSIFSIGLLTFSLFLPQESELNRLLTFYDFVLCLFFLYDFVKQFVKAERKWKYFFTIGWLDLLSSIPVVSELRYIRVFRIFRVFRIIKSIKLLADFIRKNKASSLYGFVIFGAFTILVLSTTAVLYVEQDVGNINTADDALWWSFVTITTVGYGDLYPITRIGRIIAALLIFTGIASFGAAISYITEKTTALKRS